MKYCVYGASSDRIKDIYIKEVEKLGEKMAKRGHGLVFGAGNGGCMGAAARGVKKGNGEIIGIAPSFFNVDGVLFEDCTEMIHTETMRERKKLLEEKSDAFIVAPGGIGTYDEFFEIITLKQLEQHRKAIAIFNVDGYYDNLKNIMQKLADEEFMPDESLKLAEFFDDADELLDYLENYKYVRYKPEELKFLK